MRRTVLAFILTGISAVSLIAQSETDTLRICTYNILEFSGTSNDRIGDLIYVLDSIRPNILLIQELSNEAGYVLFLDSVASRLSTSLKGSGFVGNPSPQDSYVAIFYDSSLFTPLRVGVMPDEPRAMATTRFLLRSADDSVEVITAHWKAGETTQDESIRSASGVLAKFTFQQTFPPFRYRIDNAIVAGDLNSYGSTDEGYEALTSEDPKIFYDPINAPGEWHDDSSFASIHTQSTRARQFGGGVTGGMDDRFDHVLLTDSLLARMVSGSYTTFGNDGQHFNDSINALPNLAVSPEMAQALHNASDHLPVYLDLVFPRLVTAVEERQKWKEIDLTSTP